MQIRLFRLLRTALLCATTLGAAHPASAEDSLARLKAAGTVRVAVTETSPPWSYLTDSNLPDGYDVAVAKEIFRRIGVQRVEFVADKFANFIESLATHKYDAVVNSLARTPARATKADFTVPYSVQAFRIWVNTRTNDIRSAADLSGKRVGANSGTTNELWARRNLPKSEIKTYEGSGYVYNDLANGRIDAVIDSSFLGSRMRDNNHLPIKTVGEPVTYSLGAAVVQKGATSLREAMDRAIQSMIADGTLQRLGRQYLGADYDVVGDMQKATENW
ncbi:transporter substrate-binding domain-containing protein [Chitinasiproducens palmae]|uniref:Cystine transport system substrate-binding protein n=1 Tax=Chitinasiproducens palmae TaxID=1770053 RepID=A0A1H2PKU1_9BURK|nr:transporter substrate-binding domain-containing protein [Chitinasiproducens palmae]SDV47049.1 cystine transport system substrate-binding protein [Chitinasiproducens palmae]